MNEVLENSKQPPTMYIFFPTAHITCLSIHLGMDDGLSTLNSSQFSLPYTLEIRHNERHQRKIELAICEQHGHRTPWSYALHK